MYVRLDSSENKSLRPSFYARALEQSQGSKSEGRREMRQQKQMYDGVGLAVTSQES